MEKVIEIDLNSENDVLDKYNNKKIAQELIEYLINEANYISKSDTIKLIINKKFKKEMDLTNFLKMSFKQEYLNTINSHVKNNIIQILLLLLGILFLFLSTLINSNVIWKEILLIGGWVPIWEMIDLELFNDFRGRKRKRILQKLIDSKITIN